MIILDGQSSKGEILWFAVFTLSELICIFFQDCIQSPTVPERQCSLFGQPLGWAHSVRQILWTYGDLNMIGGGSINQSGNMGDLIQGGL
jgi:hypothetical protein